MNMIRKSGSTCRLTFETADSRGSVAVARADVKGVSSWAVERPDPAQRGVRVETDCAAKRVIRCLTTVYNFTHGDSNAVFTLSLFPSRCHSGPNHKIGRRQYA